MKISFGRYFLTISMIALCSQSHGMDTQKTDASQRTPEEPAQDRCKRVGEVSDQPVWAVPCFTTTLHSKRYHLIPGDPANRPVENGFERFFHYLIPHIYSPHIQVEIPGPQDQQVLQDSLAADVQMSIDEEARISRETNGFKHVARRLAGGAILGAIVGLPVALGFCRIAKCFGAAAQPLRKAVIPYGAILAIAGMVVTEIMTRVHASSCYDVINEHRDDIRQNGLLSPDMAQQLKLSEFQHNQAAHRVIDQMTRGAVHRS